jgi:hypothetical protein
MWQWFLVGVIKLAWAWAWAWAWAYTSAVFSMNYDHIYVHTYTYTCTSGHTLLHEWYPCIYIYIYIYIYTHTYIHTYTYTYTRTCGPNIHEQQCWFIKKAVKVVTRKSRYYDTEAKTGITKTDCTKPRETQGTKHVHKTHTHKHTHIHTHTYTCGPHIHEQQCEVSHNLNF